MSIRVLSVMAAVLVTPTSAHADLLGVFFEPFVGPEWVENGYDEQAWVTYRLYADFDGPGNGVLAVYGAEDLVLEILSPDDQFHNSFPGLDSLTAPFDLRGIGIWDNQWDTYVTIGTDDAEGDATTLSEGFGVETGDLARSFSTFDASWSVTEGDPQHRADEHGRVLLGQFTVANEGHARMCMSLVNLVIVEWGQVREIERLTVNSGWCYKVEPDAYRILFGAETGGTLEDLYWSDDAVLEVQARPAIALTSPSISIEVEGHAFPFVEEMTFKLEASASALPPSVTQRVSLFNFEDDTWDQVDERNATPGDSVTTIDIESAPWRYVDFDAGTVKARVEYFDPGSLVVPGWGVRLDQAVWRVVWPP